MLNTNVWVLTNKYCSHCSAVVAVLPVSSLVVHPVVSSISSTHQGHQCNNATLQWRLVTLERQQTKSLQALMDWRIPINLWPDRTDQPGQRRKATLALSTNEISALHSPLSAVLSTDCITSSISNVIPTLPSLPCDDLEFDNSHRFARESWNFFSQIRSCNNRQSCNCVDNNLHECKSSLQKLILR